MRMRVSTSVVVRIYLHTNLPQPTLASLSEWMGPTGAGDLNLVASMPLVVSRALLLNVVVVVWRVVVES